MHDGWIKLHRAITGNELWQDKPFDKAHAWIDLLLLAKHKESTFLLGAHMEHTKPGEFITSSVKLADRWGWGRQKVRDFLSLLESEQMITKQSDNQKTRISIVNWEKYQGFPNDDNHQNNHQITSEQPSNNHQITTTKNEKKDKNEKNISRFPSSAEKYNRFMHTDIDIDALEKELLR